MSLSPGGPGQLHLRLTTLNSSSSSPLFPPPVLAQVAARLLSRGIRPVCGKQCSHVFLCNKIECMCRCSVFLQTLLLGCYKIKTIFSLSKCFPSKPLEAHNSPAHLWLLFSWGWRKTQLWSLFPGRGQGGTSDGHGEVMFPLQL